MREVVICEANQYNNCVIEKTNLGWKLIEREEMRDRNYVLTKYRITFELDDALLNDTSFLQLQDKYKQATVAAREPHTVASFVWGSLLFWIPLMYIVLFAVAWGNDLSAADPELFNLMMVFLIIPIVIGSFMITMGIVFRVKYVKNNKRLEQDRQDLIQQIKATVNSQQAK